MSGFRVLVLGGSGVFGRRLCARLAAEPRFEVQLASRRLPRAAACCAAIRRETPSARVEPVAVTLPSGLAPALEATAPDLLIDASGPFQGRDLAVLETCIDRGVHYLDLADARDFVRRFVALDVSAEAAGVIALTGASSIPALSSTVVAALAAGMSRVERIEMAILSAQRQDRGLAMVAGVLKGVGKPITALRDGHAVVLHGWQDQRRLGPDDPLFAALGPRWLGACDAPDLDLLPERYPALRDLTFSAGLEAAPAHLGLWALSWPVRLGLVPSLVPIASGLTRFAEGFSAFGSRRGGMQVVVAGRDADGTPARRAWTLLADQGDGPWVPILPAVLVARRIAQGELKRPGARACLEAFSLAEFEALLGPLAIQTQIIDVSQAREGASHVRAA